MSIEYHGWIVLANSREDWSDGDFEDGFSRVEQASQRLRGEDGHEAQLPTCVVLPRILYLKGSDVESIQEVLDLIAEVGALFNASYGELTVLDPCSPYTPWDSALARRFVVTDGKLVPLRGLPSP